MTLDRRLSKDWPGWIQHLYKKENPWHSLHSAFLLNLTNDHIAEVVEAQPKGHEELRQVALRELTSDEPQIVALSLLFLGVAGAQEDLPLVEPFLANTVDVIARAARACRFELSRA